MSIARDKSKQSHIVSSRQKVACPHFRPSQCFHVNDEAISNISFDRPLPSRFDLLNGDHLDVCHDVLFSAVIEHLLSFANTTDARARQFSPLQDEREGLDLQRLGRNPHHRHHPIPAQEIQVRSEEHTSELQSQSNLVCRLLLEKKKQL